MAKSTFKRGLKQEFVDRLNEMYSAGGWWRNLVDDTELFLAVRDDYINIYFRGCSVLKLDWRPRKKEITGEIHYKYLLQPSIKAPYVKFHEGGRRLPWKLGDLFLDDLANINKQKGAVKRYADAEKSGVHDIVMSDRNPNVLDLEIAISKEKKARRIDLAAVHEDTDQSGTVKLVFYEVKHFENKELRSSTDRIRAVDQINRYSNLIRENHDALLESYRQVCDNLFDLEGVSQHNSHRHRILRDIATGSRKLQIDDRPRLIAFGFDQDQRDGDIWKLHAEKLEGTLGENRVLFAGEPGDIRLGSR